MLTRTKAMKGKQLTLFMFIITTKEKLGPYTFFLRLQKLLVEEQVYRLLMGRSLDTGAISFMF